MKSLQIEISHLNFKYAKNIILEDINLNIYNKDFLVILGPNGGGKTTLLKLILNILTPISGQICFYLDNSKKNLSSYIGYVPQNRDTEINFPVKSIDLVLMGIAKKRGWLFYSREDKKTAMKAMESVGINMLAKSKVQDLSGGERQRLFIARAIVASPKILLLDEPTSNIDVDGQNKIYKLLKELNKSMSIVAVSHDILMLIECAKQAAYLNKTLTYHNQIDIDKSVDFARGNHICTVDVLSILSNLKSSSN